MSIFDIVNMANKKQKLCGFETGEVFTKGGICSDEITFIFDDGQELYVSQNLLRYVSPVFRAMFEHEFEERKTRTVKLPGKVYDDFLEFLLCLHPDKQKPVDNYNALRICAIAEEYQSALIIQKCKQVMYQLLSKANCSSNNSHSMANDSRTFLQILIKADSLHYENIVTKAVSSIACYGYKYFSGQPGPRKDKDIVTKAVSSIACYGYTYFSGQPGPRKNDKDDPMFPDPEPVLFDCKALYDSLSETLQNRLMSKRLNRHDKSDYHGSY